LNAPASLHAPESGVPPRRDPLDVLRTVWGYPAFRGRQAEVVEHLLGGGDALVLMPTGGGKSLCYQVPALCLGGLTLVVSPLIALMQDQVEALRQLGVRAAALNSAMPWERQREAERAMLAGEIDLVYVAPERLVLPAFQDLLARCPRLSLFAIDEAHCVSQWGHDFRPDYLQVAVLHERFPDVPRVALTATADEPTRRDIVERLSLHDGRVFVAGFDRPNIRYRVTPKDNPRQQILRLIRAEHEGDAGIVYCMSRARVEEVAAWLKAQGVPALPYHAGLAPEVRAGTLDRFLKEEGVVVVATIAFGMGIDKPNVRFVCHLDPPKSLEAYYQETGRAGRDGLPSNAWMAYGLDDVAKLTQLMANGDGDAQKRRVDRQKLDALLGYCETTTCRRQVLLGYFGERMPDPCGNCDTCLEPVRSFDGTDLAQKALSAVYRTGQRFGAGHLIDVLRGSANDRASHLGHDSLSVWGVGRDLDAHAWRSVFRQLAATGLVVVDVAGHGGLHLGPDCRPVLRGERRVTLRQDPRPAAAPRGSSRKGGPPTITPVAPTDRTLFEALRAWRLQAAREQAVPPYVVFHDATLLADRGAQAAQQGGAGGGAGMGAVKLERYGADVLRVVEEVG
jgi:ATP-dependent DNA helicase RecQ